MQTLVVANPKGGSGKTTLATNIAGWLAGRRQRVVLADFDPLRAATDWLARRPPLFPAIGGWTPDGAGLGAVAATGALDRASGGGEDLIARRLSPGRL